METKQSSGLFNNEFGTITVLNDPQLKQVLTVRMHSYSNVLSGIKMNVGFGTDGSLFRLNTETSLFNFNF